LPKNIQILKFYKYSYGAINDFFLTII